MSTFRVALAHACLLAVAAGAVRAEVTGDLDVLLLVAKQHRANKDALRTWRGKAVVLELHEGDERDPRSRKAVVEFLLDRGRDARRWNIVRSGGLFRRDDDPTLRAMPVREHRGLVNGGMFVEVQPFEVAGGKPLFVSLHEAREARGPRGTFDPMGYVEDVEPDVAARVTFFHDAAKKIDTHWHVSRAGDLVTIETRPDDRPVPGAPLYVNRYVIDLSKGASLTSFVTATAGQRESVHEYEYEQVGGLWVLRKNSYRRFKLAGGRRELMKAEIAEFSGSRINEPLDAAQFTWAAAGVPKDALITDMRPGPGFRREWVVGDKAERHPNVRDAKEGL